MLYIFLVLVSVYGAPNTLRGLGLVGNMTVGNMTVTSPAIKASYHCDEDPSCVNLNIGLGVGASSPFIVFFLGLFCSVHPWCPLHRANFEKCCRPALNDRENNYTGGHGHGSDV